MVDFPKTSLKEKFQEVKQVENIHKFKRIWTSVVWGYSWVVKDKLEAFSMLKINFLYLVSWRSTVVSQKTLPIAYIKDRTLG